MSIESMMPSSHLILCCPLLLLPSIFPSIRVFSNESIFCTRWPKDWTFSISPSNEYSGLISFQFSSVTQSCLTLVTPMDCSMPCFPVLHQLPELAQTNVHIKSVMPSNHLIICHPLLLLLLLFPSIGVFSNESGLCIRWLKY